MLALNINRKPYVGSLMTLVLTLSALEVKLKVIQMGVV